MKKQLLLCVLLLGGRLCAYNIDPFAVYCKIIGGLGGAYVKYYLDQDAHQNQQKNDKTPENKDEKVVVPQEASVDKKVLEYIPYLAIGVFGGDCAGEISKNVVDFLKKNFGGKNSKKKFMGNTLRCS